MKSDREKSQGFVIQHRATRVQVECQLYAAPVPFDGPEDPELKAIFGPSLGTWERDSKLATVYSDRREARRAIRTLVAAGFVAPRQAVPVQVENI